MGAVVAERKRLQALQSVPHAQGSRWLLDVRRVGRGRTPPSDQRFVLGGHPYGGGGQSASSWKTRQQPPSQLGPASFNSHPAQCGDRMPPSDSTGGSQVLTGDGSPDTRGDGPGIHPGGRPVHPPDFSEPPPQLSRSSLPTAAPEAPTRQHRPLRVTFF